jgi:lipocalin
MLERSTTSGAAQLVSFPERYQCKVSKQPNGAIARRSYSVVYDDDLDSWSVVSTPFDGVYFVGAKPHCEAFVTTMGISGLRLLQRN